MDASFHYSEKRPHTAVQVVVSIGRWPQRAGIIADSSLRVSATSKMPTGVQRDLRRKKLPDVRDRREATAPAIHTAEATGSIPVSPTNKPNDGKDPTCC